MKVNYHRTSPKKKQIYFAVIVSILVVGWLFPRLLSGISYIVLYPIQSVTSWYQHSQSVFPTYLRTRAELAAEIETLQQKIAAESGTQLSLRRIQEENAQLRAATNFGTSTSRVMARVIAEPNRLNYDLLQIDKGTEAGLMVGSPVFVGVDTVVGVVTHASPQYSFVALFTTPGFTGTAFVIGPNVFAPLEGVGGGIARIRVPQGVPITVGDLVLMPSVESGVYGEIVSVENLPTQPEQFGYVAPPVPLRSISYVSVIAGVPPVRTVEDVTTQLTTELKDYFKLDTAAFPEDFIATTTLLGTTTEETSEDLEGNT